MKEYATQWTKSRRNLDEHFFIYLFKLQLSCYEIIIIRYTKIYIKYMI